MTAKRNYLPVLLIVIIGAILSVGLASLERPADAAVPLVPPVAAPQAGASVPSGATATPTCEVAWRAVQAPSPGANVFLRGVTALNANVAWAVGDYSNGQQLLTMRWNGTVWDVIPNPNPGGNYVNYLYGVAGVATDDVWAVGFYRRFSPNSLIMHWDGNAWTYQSGPYPGTIPWLYAIHAIATDDVWAVGYSGTNTSLIYHWNGANWSIVNSPNIGTLYGVGGAASDDAWAVGTGGIMHWDGSAWSNSPAPNVGTLRDVDAFSSQEAWAVGDAGILRWDGSVWTVSSSSGGTSVKAVAANDAWVTSASGMLHWDGAQWDVEPSPYIGMAAIAGIASDDLWAIGSSSGSPLTQRYSFACSVGTPTPTSTPTATITSTATPTCGPPSWNVSTSPSVGIYDNFLYDVSAVSSTEIWAVGYYCTGNCTAGPSQTLTMRWDGSEWTYIPSADVGSENNALLGVSAFAPDNVWAVGTYTSGGTSRNLIQRWNGSAWSIVTSPNVGNGQNTLNKVSAATGNDVWAVGYYANAGGVLQTLILRWNGTAWSVATSPNVGTGQNILTSVSARTASDAWAVGSYNTGGPGMTLTMRWNGTAWSVVTSPNVGTLPNILYSVTALAANDVWAAGHYYINGAVTQTLVEHWNGAAWSVQLTPNQGTGPNTLRGVSALSTNDVWAVGYYCNGSCGTNPYQTLVERWNGTGWSTVASPNISTTNYNYLVAVDAVSSNETYGAGYYRTSGAVYKTLALRRFGSSCDTLTPTPTATVPTPALTPTVANTFTPTRTATNSPTSTQTSTPTQTATGTPPTATSTATMGSHTATPTPTITPTSTNTPIIDRTYTSTVTGTPEGTATVTPCPMNFSDVQLSDYFYVPVRYLFCAGVISGYSDGTFRPYNNTTRGQLSKIIVLAEGWALDCPLQPQFSDVDSTNPFYCHIETAYARGIISGYADGTFRPGNNVTRGQLSKIIVLAEGWANDCPPPGRFSDVPTTHPFFCYIETAYNRGIITGYSDGTFRPGNNATRGQICKIVYQAVTLP